MKANKRQIIAEGQFLGQSSVCGITEFPKPSSLALGTDDIL